MKTDKYLLIAGAICMFGALGFNWEFWGKSFALYTIAFLLAGLIVNIWRGGDN